MVTMTTSNVPVLSHGLKSSDIDVYVICLTLTSQTVSCPSLAHPKPPSLPTRISKRAPRPRRHVPRTFPWLVWSRQPWENVSSSSSRGCMRGCKPWLASRAFAAFSASSELSSEVRSSRAGSQSSLKQSALTEFGRPNFYHFIIWKQEGPGRPWCNIPPGNSHPLKRPEIKLHRGDP